MQLPVTKLGAKRLVVSWRELVFGRNKNDFDSDHRRTAPFSIRRKCVATDINDDSDLVPSTKKIDRPTHTSPNSTPIFGDDIQHPRKYQHHGTHLDLLIFEFSGKEGACDRYLARADFDNRVGEVEAAKKHDCRGKNRFAGPELREDGCRTNEGLDLMGMKVDHDLLVA